MSGSPSSLARSYLYVPGHRAVLLAKARSSSADAIVIDLEDAVPELDKSRARGTAADAAVTAGRQHLWVRINAVATGCVADDIAAAAGPHLVGVRVPKVESVDEVQAVASELADHGCAAAIHCMIESALGLERIFQVARADSAVTGVSLGEADLGADLGTDLDEGLLYARSRCVAAARAAGLAPPVQSVFINVTDEDGLRRTTELGRGLGFFGRSAVHPRQLAVINDVYTPSADLVRRAQELIDALERAVARGSSAFVMPDGRFVDAAVVASARRTLELSGSVRPEAP
jgi:citrate lyase subunit beta/citryl-CoA lyase